MALHKNRQGLELPISGTPDQVIENARAPRRVALLGGDYVGMKPTMHVGSGDVVRRGQLLFEDKKTPGVRFTSPADGTVAAVHRGDKRSFQSLVIDLSSAELGGGAGSETPFRSYTGRGAEGLTADSVRELLLESGAWTALRARPYGRVANPAAQPHSIFVTAMDSEPLAPDPAVLIGQGREALRAGIAALSKLTEGSVYVCTGAEVRLDVPDDPRISVERFRGPHPSGTVGWHIHTLDPVRRRKIVWHVGLQDAIAIGQLFLTGRVHLDRIVSLAGPGVRRPRLLRTRVGASIDDLVDGELEDGAEMRVISGSVLAGRAVAGEVYGYLGRYDQQISVIAESREREFLGWLGPGFSKFSVLNTFVSKLVPGKRFDLTTSTHGSQRAIIPIGLYERVFPFDIQPTFLLRAIAVGDVETAEQLGCLELEEADVALCSFVDPGKSDFGPQLREVLTTLEKEG